MALTVFARHLAAALAMLLPMAPAAAASDVTCYAHTIEARQQCRQVLATLRPAVVFEDEVWHGSLSERARFYNVPGVSIAFIDHGRVAWRATYGQRNDNGTPVSTQTVFQAASISKPVAATLTLLLVDSGELKLDAPVNSQLRSWQLPDSGDMRSDAVTLRRLLSHSAGINVHGFPGYAAGIALPTEDQILDGQTPANSPPIRLVLKPGSAYRYSGGGYQIAQALIEDAAGTPFAEVARKRLLDPMGMQRTDYSAELPKRFSHNVAVGHGYDGKALPGGWHRYPELAAAALWSTSDDLARYFVAVMQAAHGHPHRPLTPRIAQQMLTPAIEGMGLGFGVHGEGADRLVDQAGATAGYRTYMAGYPKRGQGVIIMTNSDGGKDLIDEICRSLAHAYAWPDFKSRNATAAAIDPATLQKRAGDYRVNRYGFTLHLQRRGNALLASTPRGQSFTFRPLSAWKFLAEEDASELVFDPKEPGRLQVWGMHAERIHAPE